MYSTDEKSRDFFESRIESLVLQLAAARDAEHESQAT